MNAKAQKIAGEDSAATKKKATKEQPEADRLDRLKNLQNTLEESKTAPRWVWENGEYAWYQYDDRRRIFFDSGARLTSQGVKYPDNWIFPEGYTPPR